MAGWDQLGRVLGGSGNTTDAYQRGQSKAAQLEGLISQARVKRAEADAMANAPGTLVKLGLPADLADILRAGWDPTKLSGYSGDMQEQGFRGDAASRALAGDWGGANAALMGIANGPQQLAKIEGQNLLGNVFLEGGGGISTTEQGRAGMAADVARGRASDASAANSYASANRTRQATGIDAAEFGMKRAGQWNPGGASTAAGAGAEGGGLKLTEGQSKDMVYLRRGTAANNLLKTQGGNLTMTGGTQGMRGMLDNAIRGLPFGFGEGAMGNAAVSGDRQQAEQSAREYLAAILRKDTGAAITSQEMDIYGRMYLPQPGDSDATLLQKERAREVALEAIGAGLGPERAALAMPPAGDVFSGAVPPPGAAPALPPAAPGTRRKYNPATGRIE